MRLTFPVGMSAAPIKKNQDWKVTRMNPEQYHALSLRATDVPGAVKRLSGDEGLYAQCLRMFLADPTVTSLNGAVKTCAWDDAFTAAHALKGVAGNMGFIPLMHAASELVILIRGGRLNEIAGSLEQVNSTYRDIMDAIHQYFALADEGAKGESI